jgi:carbonic anhydrase
MPYQITGKEPGELFILRNIGNLVPPYNAKENSVAAAIEYAIKHLGISEIILCGHSDCGGMKAVFTGAEENSDISNWVKHAVSPDNFKSSDELSKANMLAQIENLKTYPSVKSGLREKRLEIHAQWTEL